MVEGGGDGLEVISFELAVTADTCIDDAVEDLTCHATETDLKIMFLHTHVDENGGHRIDGERHIGIFLFCQPNQTFEDLLLGLEHTVHLFHRERALVVALVHVCVHHIGRTQEMEDVGMGLRLVSKDVQCIFEECSGNFLKPRQALLCLVFLVLFVFLLFLHVATVERRIGCHPFDAVEVPVQVFAVKKTDESEHPFLYQPSLHRLHGKRHHPCSCR